LDNYEIAIEMGKNGAVISRKLYLWKKISPQYLKLIKNLLK